MTDDQLFNLVRLLEAAGDIRRRYVIERQRFSATVQRKFEDTGNQYAIPDPIRISPLFNQFALERHARRRRIGRQSCGARTEQVKRHIQIELVENRRRVTARRDNRLMR